MEDSHTEILSLKEDKGTAFFGVYDGHGGRCYYNNRCINILVYNITKAKLTLWLANWASTICPWVYAADVLTKAKHALCDVAQFVAELLGCTSQVHDSLNTVMMCIVVDKSTDHAIPHSICFFLPQYQSLRNTYLSWQLNTNSDLKVHALHCANELFARVRLFFQKLLQTCLICRNNTMFML